MDEIERLSGAAPMSAKMTVRQAARWAERNDCLCRANPSTGAPEYMYVVYDVGSHLVQALGSFEKCKALMPPPGQATAQGRWLRLEALETIVQEMDEEEGERQSIPDACDVREWE